MPFNSLDIISPEPSHESAQTTMNTLAYFRTYTTPPPSNVETVRFPVGLFFVRDDRAGDGAKVAEQIKASSSYWDLNSGDSIDFILAGWNKCDAQMSFNLKNFYQYCTEIENVSRWHYSGESDLVLLNFDYSVSDSNGEFCFEEVIVLPVEELLREKKIGSLDKFMEDIIDLARDRKSSLEESAIWEISDRIGYLRGKKAVWDGLKKMFLKDFASVYDELRPFVVCDLRKIGLHDAPV
jgi:hypothetical protein